MTQLGCAIILAKHPDYAPSKTRLVNASIDQSAASAIALAMLRCVVARLREAFSMIALAVTPDDAATDLAERLDVPIDILCGQGHGDLGQRISRVWKSVGTEVPAACFGMDSPDIPRELLRCIQEALDDHHVAVGPTPDGGYWTLAAREHPPAVLLEGIDWGSATVYDTTVERARSEGLQIAGLPGWFDVDDPADLYALMQRLGGLNQRGESDPHLHALHNVLTTLLISSSSSHTQAPHESSSNMNPTTADSESRLAEVPAGIDLSTASILLVDDNQQNLELMQAYLEELPCTLVLARDGIEAVAQIEQRVPDMVLLDVMMPRMSGFEVCQKMKANPATRDVPVIMVTALHEVGDVERAVEAGADDFISKPVNKLELVTRVRSLLGFRLVRQRMEADLRALRAQIGPDEYDRRHAGEKLE
ncbi:MAG: DUF2064 domain-containing protein [Phycisphaerales bacterium]